ncbi:arginine--tRNA ligase, partial [Francisella tularensis subsp. holarctica]|nr:arginine--tRNA ligase [Francisella tularensis subsp. holarctica]
KKPPLAIDEEIVENIYAEDILSKLEVAKPVYINITLAPKFLADTTNRILNSNKFCVQNNLPNMKVVLDYCGQNVDKTMHVGH